MKTKCWECWGLNGRHWPHCQSRGYDHVGFHPDAPAREAVQTPDPTPCPCGIARLDCEYHRPEPETERAAGGFMRVRSACGQYVQTFRDGKLVDEEPVEAFAYSPAVLADALGATLPGLAFANCRCALHPIVKVDIS